MFDAISILVIAFTLLGLILGSLLLARSLLLAVLGSMRHAASARRRMGL